MASKKSVRDSCTFAISWDIIADFKGTLVGSSNRRTWGVLDPVASVTMEDRYYQYNITNLAVTKS